MPTQKSYRSNSLHANLSTPTDAKLCCQTVQPKRHQYSHWPGPVMTRDPHATPHLPVMQQRDAQNPPSQSSSPTVGKVYCSELPSCMMMPHQTYGRVLTTTASANIHLILSMVRTGSPGHSTQVQRISSRTSIHYPVSYDSSPHHSFHGASIIHELNFAAHLVHCHWSATQLSDITTPEWSPCSHAFECMQAEEPHACKETPCTDRHCAPASVAWGWIRACAHISVDQPPHVCMHVPAGFACDYRYGCGAFLRHPVCWEASSRPAESYPAHVRSLLPALFILRGHWLNKQQIKPEPRGKQSPINASTAFQHIRHRTACR